MIKLKSLLNESSPGFENRQVGDPLPTLDSIQAAYQAKQGLQEAESFTATSKDSGKTTVFKSKSNRDAAIKAGTHEKAAKGGDSPPAGKDTSKADKTNMFSKDTGYDAGGEPKSEPTKIPSKYDDASFWEDDEKNDSTGIDHYDGDSGEFYDDDDDDDDEYGGGSTEATKQTAERLDKIDKALDYELNLSRSGFSMDRSSSGGSGGFEGPLTISHENADFDNPENSAQLSIGSGENNGKFTIGFTDLDGQPLFDGDYSLTDDDFEPQDTHKMAKAIMKMPEVDKLLKGELSPEEFKPIYAKLKSKFNKSSKNEGKSSLVEGKSYKDRFKYLANIK